MRIIDWSSDVFSSDLDPDDENSTVMHVAAPIRDADGRIAGVLTVAKPNQAIAPFIERSQQAVLRWGLVLLDTALLVGVLAAWWLSRQVGRLQRDRKSTRLNSSH